MTRTIARAWHGEPGVTIGHCSRPPHQIATGQHPTAPPTHPARCQSKIPTCQDFVLTNSRCHATRPAREVGRPNIATSGTSGPVEKRPAARFNAVPSLACVQRVDPALASMVAGLTCRHVEALNSWVSAYLPPDASHRLLFARRPIDPCMYGIVCS